MAGKAAQRLQHNIIQGGWGRQRTCSKGTVHRLKLQAQSTRVPHISDCMQVWLFTWFVMLAEIPFAEMRGIRVRCNACYACTSCLAACLAMLMLMRLAGGPTFRWPAHICASCLLRPQNAWFQVLPPPKVGRTGSGCVSSCCFAGCALAQALSAATRQNFPWPKTGIQQ